MPCDNSCPLNPSIVQILTYDYCDEHIAINYSLILLLQAAVLLHGIPTKIVAFSTFYLWAFQVILCLIVGCVGVSVVWSAQLGILMHRRHHLAAKSSPHQELPPWSWKLFSLSLVVGSTTWVYYAVIWEPITTLAHVCALVMGILLGAFAQLWDHLAPPLPSAPSSSTEPSLSDVC